jgi:nitronate monooxygenase
MERDRPRVFKDLLWNSQLRVAIMHLPEASATTSLPRFTRCSLGYLRTPYIDDDGKIGYRCPAEPVEDWLKKGGEIEATKGRKCLCNALCANVGFPQTRAVKTAAGEKETYVEGKLITIGDEVNNCRLFMKQDETGKWGYSAADVVDYLKSEWNESLLRNEIQSTVFGTEENVDAPQANS